MTEQVEADTGESSYSQHSAPDARSVPGMFAGRRVPFVLRVATSWTELAELPFEGDGQLRAWRRTPLTGRVTATDHGRDVSFSDLEVV